MARLNGFTKQQLLDIYNTMVLARELDNRMLTLIKQGKGFFHMGCSGHESAQIAAFPRIFNNWGSILESLLASGRFRFCRSAARNQGGGCSFY